jgi:hypothetical protein
MTIVAWSHWTYFDPMLNETAMCVTGYTGHGAYWIRAPLAPAGKTRRAAREEMLDRIRAAVEAGEQPGEVSMAGPAPVHEGESEHGREEDRGIW